MKQQSQRFSLLRTFKIGSFHIGSSLADILTSAVWNRILVSDLLIPATPVSLLSALRYLLAPLSIWIGHRSDTHPIFGLHRMPYIWFGRLMMLLTLPMLPITTILLAEDKTSLQAWGLVTLTFLIYGIGSLISGSPFLALVRDSAPPNKRGQALSIVQIMLLFSFALSPALYGAIMEEYSPQKFWEVVLIGMAISTPFWIFAIWGEEKRGQDVATTTDEDMPTSAVLKDIWSDRRVRYFFIFMFLATGSAFAQDAILEPFGGDVFGLEVGDTTRFNVYWGVGVLLAMILTTIITRKRAPHEQGPTATIGLILTIAPLAMLGVAALTRSQALIIPMLALFGFGFGIYTVGGISLLMAMTADNRAGAYLGLWTVAQLVSRGVGIALGGMIRDLALWVSGMHTVAYATVFFLEAVGLFICIFLLPKADVVGFVRGQSVATTSPLAALAD